MKELPYGKFAQASAWRFLTEPRKELKG